MYGPGYGRGRTFWQNSSADARERDRAVDLAVVGQRVDVVVGGDPL